MAITLFILTGDRSGFCFGGKELCLVKVRGYVSANSSYGNELSHLG
ncbi:MAG: hypothetical protein RMY34_31155 [Aulosira sp. DedQUE10]|nr:hypothetical protein [Aulosira sp. DedQUE10]